MTQSSTKTATAAPLKKAAKPAPKPKTASKPKAASNKSTTNPKSAAPPAESLRCLPLVAAGDRARIQRQEQLEREALRADFTAYCSSKRCLPPPSRPTDSAALDRLVERIRSSVVGADEVVDTPYGKRRVTYADYTASGRALSFIEDFISQEVMPLYANTHTEASTTGLQTGRFREEARSIIMRACGACPDKDALVFCGSGATAAIKKIVEVLEMSMPHGLKVKLQGRIPEKERPVVFIGPYEHHSNELIWRESFCEVVVVPENEEGHLDLVALEKALESHKHHTLRVGSFSAGSNVTGVLTDTDAVSRILHKHGALSFWDYAAAAPYVPIEMNKPLDGVADGMAYKDAVFISPHKFPGGPQTPGILIAKRNLFQNEVPTTPGGGTVKWVSELRHAYDSDPVHREEAGTPAIVDSIRCGLVFQLKEAVGGARIARLEHGHLQTALKIWSDVPNLHVLGPKTDYRLSIVSMVITHKDTYLHYNFVAALLSDLFGVQARGGCSCAGPYGQRLLRISNDDVAPLLHAVNESESLKPGWFRVNFNYFFSTEETTFIAKAIAFVATHGWKFLVDYEMDQRSGQWQHKNRRCCPVLRHSVRSLHDIDFSSGLPVFDSRHERLPPSAALSKLFDEYMAEALALSKKKVGEVKRKDSLVSTPLTPSLEPMRSFLLPFEAAQEIQNVKEDSSSSSHWGPLKR